MPIVAEIGQNHCGNMKLAVDLIKKARDNGASLAKFQLYDSQKAYGNKQASELSFGQAETLVKAGDKIGIPVFFSIFDMDRLSWCKEFDLHHYKIAYSQRNNAQLLDAIPEEATVFISTKGGYDYELPYAVPIKLFCVPKYPADVNMFTLPDFTEDFDGYSDHTIGLDVAKIALAQRAMWIEKHFAIDHETGVDAPWSMTPNELLELVKWEETVRCVA